MSTDYSHQCKEKMHKSVEAFTSELAKLRTGRAHPNLLDHIRVENYGAEVPLKQVASIVIEDARTLAVTPWEKSMIAHIEKAIKVSNLGINPIVNGGTIRVPLPALTEERRQDLIRVAKAEAENARVSVRNVRRQILADVKQLTKDKEMTQDEERGIGNQVQSITDETIKEIEGLLAEKEKDLLSI